MNVKDTRLARLKQIIDGRFKGRAGQCADFLGIKRPQMSRWVTSNEDARQGIAEESARAIEGKLGLQVGWLDRPLFIDQPDGGSPTVDDLAARAQEEVMRHGAAPFDQNVELAKLGRRIPIIDYVQAGAWREIADPFPPGMAYEYLLSSVEVSGTAFALRIKGDSMEPDFIEGDVIVVDPAVSPRPGSFVVAKNGGEEATFKKYRARGVDPATGEDIFELVPLNDDYPTLRSDECRCVIIGTAVEVRKRLR